MSQQFSDEFLAQKTWDLYQTYGVPFEVSEDILNNKGFELNWKILQKLIDEHQELSRTTSAGQFKSGLGTDSSKTRKLHTVTHILHTVLRNIFGNETKQMGSAITEDKARFDFSLDRAITPEELEQIQQSVQEVINKNLSMKFEEMSFEEAVKTGAIGLFGEKYGEKVTVYSLTDDEGKTFSKEFCGGPHVANTQEIGKFSLLKQKSVGQGIRRLEFDVV